MRTWQDAYAHVFPPERLAELAVETREAGWREQLRAQGERAATFVAESDAAIVGFASVGPCRDADAGETTGELYAIYVLRSEWGRGTGRALMEASFGALREAGFREATLWVLGENPRTRPF